ncbi:D-2-hydroxyacid dehydrogenase [Variovorax terrae]|uniref:D-2-hydroxyacid dehydrogenase n=1 Tax=Variovorax terrae TaxID=2923278 RepID=A0A9X1W5D6_9BURK|nr:D-2-hydroxyacid dehydrogenase [Variovorax terrae]MCJ0766043.1 D-2-hydroxyacid dehydrogenase [Variovorax terrae]
MRILYWPKIQLGRAVIAEQLGAVPGAELTVTETLPQLLAALPGAAGVVLADAPEAEARQVVEQLRAPGNTVRWLHFVSAGREGFEAAGLPPGIAVTYAAGAAAPAVAEHAMALLLALGRRIPVVLAQQAERHWDRAAPGSRAWALEGKTLVIVGYGQIGQEIAKRARPFGARIVALSRSARPDALVDEALPLSQLHEALGRADAVMLSIALTPETQHLIGRDALARLKPGTLLVNVARGGVIDQVALREALHNGRLAGAGLDVVDPEPLPATDPLWDSPNLILSPHFAGSGSPATVARLAGGAAENLRRFIAGQPLLHQVAG